MKRIVLLAIAACMLTSTSVAAAENLVLLQTKSGEQVVPETTLLKETIVLTGTSCSFTMPKGKLKENAKPSLEIRFPSFHEEGCEGGGNAVRFYKTTFSQLSGVELKAESTAAGARVKVGACIYRITEMTGLQAVPGLVETEVSGTGITKEGCTETMMFKGPLELRLEEGAKTLTYIEF